MTNQEIVDYVINTPNNTNPVILKQMLKDITGSGNLQLDTTLTIAGAAADAKAVGDAISKLSGGDVGQMEQLQILIETDMLPAVHDEAGKILTDENGNVILRY